MFSSTFPTILAPSLTRTNAIAAFAQYFDDGGLPFLILQGRVRTSTLHLETSRLAL
jgi:hypothetical protein